MKPAYVALTAVVALCTGCARPAESTKASPKDAPSAKAESTPQAPAAKPITIPAGTPIKVWTTSTLSTENVESGAAFTATLAEPLIVDGKQIAPNDAAVDGVVVNADKGGRVKGVASISVRLTKLHVGREAIAIKTSAYTKQARATKKRDAVKVGIASGVGAAIGAIAGGGKGAAIGAASGAGAGTGLVLATRGEPAVIGAESRITFRLTAPVEVKE